MGLADAFGPDDRTTIKTGQLLAMLKEAAASELLQNAVNCDVPHKYIREMISGVKEGPEVNLIQTTPALVGCVTKTPEDDEGGEF